MWLYHRVMSLNDADGMANSVDPDLIWVCTICPGISVRKLRIITVYITIWIHGTFGLMFYKRIQYTLVHRIFFWTSLFCSNSILSLKTITFFGVYYIVKFAFNLFQLLLTSMESQWITVFVCYTNDSMKFLNLSGGNYFFVIGVIMMFREVLNCTKLN